MCAKKLKTDPLGGLCEGSKKEGLRLNWRSLFLLHLAGNVQEEKEFPGFP